MLTARGMCRTEGEGEGGGEGGSHSTTTQTGHAIHSAERQRGLRGNMHISGSEAETFHPSSSLAAPTEGVPGMPALGQCKAL